MMKRILAWFGFLLLGSVWGQECPAGWTQNGEKCYKFTNYPQLNYQAAVVYCQEDGATLISIEDSVEHNFIKNWLVSHDLGRAVWWTSGRTDKQGRLHWEGTGSPGFFTNGWLPDASKDRNEMSVVYKFDGADFGWDVSDRWVTVYYICEINRNEVYRISQENRGFSYGLNVQNPSEVPRGPYFLKEPESVTLLITTTLVFFECVAGGNPEVSYQWLRKNVGGDKMMPIGSDNRYSTLNGRLNIKNPDVDKDQGIFQCKVSNTYGTILSSPVELSFGSIGDFSTVASADVEATENKGAQLECPNIQGSPRLIYTWYKNSQTSFIRPEVQTHSFISASGKLLFSHASESDNGTYYCVASLTGFGQNRNYLGASRVPSRTSRGFRLGVRRSVGNRYNVDIQKEFIYVFPKTPMRGSTIRLECFAYGSRPLSYSWGKRNRPFPEGRHKFFSANRIVLIYEVELSDDDEYYCNVTSSKTNSKQSTTLSLEVMAKPYFVYPLKHQHLDTGSHLTWHCEAMGKPFPTYTWYKDGAELASSSGIRVVGNTLTIQSVEAERDEGMYQCGAKNDFGESISTAQLRVLEMKPSFERSPMPKMMFGASGGSVTLECKPIGAPRPTLAWFRDGTALGLTPGVYQTTDHYRMLISGHLVITDINGQDAGRYKCTAENSHGKAEDYTDFTIHESAQFYRKPQDDEVEVNMTVTLQCQASHTEGTDMVYIWSFNDHVIDFDREPEYRMGQSRGKEEGNLYVTSAQFRNEGHYTCAVVSASDKQEASCYLDVNGPPGEPAGVNIHLSRPEGVGEGEEEGIQLATTRWVTWMDGDRHGDSITHYFIQFRSEFDQNWRIHPDGSNIPVARTLVENKADLRYARLTDLKTGAAIQFRVLARNGYGIGTPSLPTTSTEIAGAPPSKTVTNIRGGGGKVGDLTIWWDPLPREDHNGADLEYIVEWKKHRDGVKAKWEKTTVKHKGSCITEINIEMGSLFVCQFVKLVGEFNYYTEYDVRIQAKNNKGPGPISKSAIVMSAELLPVGAPTEIYGRVFNSTALNITWIPVPNDRKSAGGTIKGYKINYWRTKNDTESQAQQNIIELKKGQSNLGHGLIIGLQPVTWYSFNIQAYNSAGNGLKSSDNEQQTLNNVAEKFPTEVYIYSVDGKGVRVNFRGVSTQAREEPLQGYKVQVWKSTENIRSAQEYDFGKTNSGVIKNLNSSVVYQLRVFAYSRAGQGKRSSPTVYFTVGDGQIISNPETTEIMAGVSTVSPSLVLTLLVLSASACSTFLVS